MKKNNVKNHLGENDKEYQMVISEMKKGLKPKTIIIYNSLAKKIGYVDFEQLKMNEDEIDNQTKILFNRICEMEKVTIYFLF